MTPHESNRRDFLKSSAATAALTVAAGSLAHSPTSGAAYGAGTAGPERRRFGNTDMSVGVLGFGGAEIGFEKTDPKTVEKLLQGALDAGLNVVDTAECYGDSEIVIGKTIGNRRKDYYLFTKCGHAPEAEGWTKEAILRSIERSLKRLQTDVVDLVNLHSCSLDELKKGECIEALEQAKKEGKTRYIGYSGDSEAARYAVECGRFDALQTSLNICDQEPLDLTLPLAKQKNMGVICKRPIANAVWRYDKKPENGYHVEYWNRLQKLKYDFAMGDAAKKQDASGPAATAMRFVAMQPGVHVLIVGTTKPERWKQNAELISAGPLPKELEQSIRNRWKAVAESDWTGQT